MPSKQSLPRLDAKHLHPTRDYLRAVAQALASLQRGFIPPNPHEWHYGLLVNMRGIITQDLVIDGQSVQASLDLVRSTVRFAGASWSLKEYDGPEIYNNIRSWLESHAGAVALEKPHFLEQKGSFDEAESLQYAQALWWMEQQFRVLKKDLNWSGTVSPILFYPHHFDLSLVWFPFNDKRQVGIGWSTGDDTFAEPYVYITVYPVPEQAKKLKFDQVISQQEKEYRLYIVPYSLFSENDNPERLFQSTAGTILKQAKQLLG